MDVTICSLYIVCLCCLCGIHGKLPYFCGVIQSHDDEIDGVCSPEVVTEAIL